LRTVEKPPEKADMMGIIDKFKAKAAAQSTPSIALDKSRKHDAAELG